MPSLADYCHKVYQTGDDQGTSVIGTAWRGPSHFPNSEHEQGYVKTGNAEGAAQRFANGGSPPPDEYTETNRKAGKHWRPAARDHRLARGLWHGYVGRGGTNIVGNGTFPGIGSNIRGITGMMISPIVRLATYTPRGFDPVRRHRLISRIESICVLEISPGIIK